MKKALALLLIFASAVAWARYEDVDGLRSTDHTYTWSLPTITGTLLTQNSTATVSNKTISGSSNTLSNIAYSSLVLTGSVVNADIANAAAIAYSKLALTGSIVNADISSSAAIAYSKLSLGGSILNSDLAGSIADSKLSTISTSGKVANSATTATSANTASAIVARDANGDFTARNITATTVTAALAGNASTATALAANPTDCSAGQYATTIDAGGNLTCAQVATSQISGTVSRTTQIATGSANQVLINDGSGTMSSEATLAKSRGGAGADMSSVTFPSSGVIDTTAAANTITNHSYTDPVVTDAVRIAEQSSTPSTPAAGYKKIYPKNDGKLYTLNSSGSEVEVGSGASSTSSINYIKSNPDAETNTTGWAAYSDSQTATVTIASPAVFTITSTTGMYVGMPLSLTTSGALPTGLTASTTYYVSSVVSSTTFKVASTLGGSDVNTSGSQSGTHTFRPGVPLTGTGGSPTITMARSLTNPLRGSASFELAKDAANREGEGQSFDFTLDRADKGQPIQISFNYEITSGTYADADLKVWIFDKTNSRLISPDVPDLKTTSIQNVYSQKFQASSDSTSYRLIIHASSPSASAYTVHYDNVKVSPEQSVRGAIIANGNYVPTFGAGYGSVTSVSASWTRVGNKLFVYGTFTTGTVAGSTSSITLPSFCTPTPTAFLSGYILTQTSGTSGVNNTAPLVWSNSASAMVISNIGTGTVNHYSTINGNTVMASSTAQYFYAQAECTGWNSGTDIASDNGDGRPVEVIYYGHGSASANAVIKYTTMSKDTHNAYSSSTGLFTAPVAGYYLVTAGTDGNVTALNAIYASVNGAAAPGATSPYLGWAPSTNAPITGSAGVYLNVGDTLQINCTGSMGAGSVNGDRLTISRIGSGAPILAGETVATRVTLTTSQTAVASKVIPFNSVTYDKTGSLNTSTGVYTVPVSGIYRIDAAAVFGSMDGSTNAYLQIRKNASAIDQVYCSNLDAVTSSVSCKISDTYQFLQGDTIDIWAQGDASFDIDNNGTRTFENIQRVGNY